MINYKKLYKSYIKEYKNTYNKNKNLSNKLSYSDYIDLYEDFREDLMSNDDIKDKTHVNRYIVKHHIEFTYKQARSYSKAAKLSGLNYSTKDLMQDADLVDSMREQIKIYGRDLKEKGYTSTEIALMVGEYFFGS